MRFYTKFFLAFLLTASLPYVVHAAREVRLLNASYDPTREFYDDYNEWFKVKWANTHDQKVVIRQSHSGSGKQARAIMDGLPAEVATLALAYDLDAIAEKSGYVPKDWRKKLPNDAVPMTSTVVFLVRKGNPKAIHDWADLVRDGVEIIAPSPKTSGGARWNYLAAWVYAIEAHGGNEVAAKEFIRKLYANVKVLDAGARGSTTTFAQRRIGDVLITWEMEAYLAKRQLGDDKFEIIYPSISILAEPPVAVVEKVAEHKQKTVLAYAYLRGLYEKPAQELAAKHFFRPINLEVMQQYRAQFPELKTVSINTLGGWDLVQKKHFADGGIFDEIYAQ
jgi:sulfate transport system substrate-binding protein